MAACKLFRRLPTKSSLCTVVALINNKSEASARKVSEVADKQHSHIFWDPRGARGQPLTETHMAKTRKHLGQFHWFECHDASSRCPDSFQSKNLGHHRSENWSRGFSQEGKCSESMCSVWQTFPTAFSEGIPRILEQTKNRQWTQKLRHTSSGVLPISMRNTGNGSNDYSTLPSPLILALT